LTGVVMCQGGVAFVIVLSSAALVLLTLEVDQLFAVD
jgi:hypothetical protein